MKTDKLFLASGNPHKIEELKLMLEPLGISLKSTQDIENSMEIVEDQPDLEGNALKKARAWFRRIDIPTLSDDTGLEVDALNGKPGVYSARYAGENAGSQENVEKLLLELSDADDRSARFRTVIAYTNGVNEFLFEGVCEGTIIKKPEGSRGFGYDPVFKPNGFDQTFAELSSEQKNKISHRGIALRKFIEFLKEQA